MNMYIPESYKNMNQNLNNLLIHIGYHKAASTWLQHILFTSENNVFEPLSRSNKGHSTLAKYFVYDEECYLLSPFDDNKKNIQNEITNILHERNFDSKLPVMSHERLSGNPHSSGFDAKKIATMLYKFFPQAKILIIIREQKSFILSNYFQYLAKGGIHGLEKYLNTKYDGKRPFFSPNHINYIPLINEYYNLFKPQNVLVLPYEMFNNEPSTFLNYLEKFLNVSIDLKIDNFNELFNKKTK